MKHHIAYAASDERGMGVFRLFEAKEGSKYIATPVTIQALMSIHDAQPLRHVLEMGAGIGTITYTLLKYTNAHVDTYEDNAFCMSALQTNVAGFGSRYTLLKSYGEAPPRKQYDLVIVDGGGGKSHDGGAESIVEKIASLVDSPLFYIEGQRYQQRIRLRRTLAKRYRYSIVEYDGVTIDGVYYKGGIAIRCTPSSSALIRTLNFYYWELVEWTSIKNALLYRWSLIKRFFMGTR